MDKPLRKLNTQKDMVDVQRILSIKKNAENYIKLIENLEVFIPGKGMLAGKPFFFRTFTKEMWLLRKEMHYGADNCHFPMNPSFLQYGFAGIMSLALKAKEGLDEEKSAFLQAIIDTYDAVCKFIERHAEKAEQMAFSASDENERRRLEAIAANCRVISKGAPQNFIQAVQLFWFAWRLRNIFFSSTIGRLDQYLYPFYKRDIEIGSLTKQEAFSILCELWENFNLANSGDTLMNLMVGGQDRQGNDATNELSFMMIDTALAVRKSEPHLNVRIHKGTPQAFIDKVVDLILLGHGQGTIYCDDHLIPSLVNHGIPPESARNYSNDGCTEVVIDGESGIRFWQMEAVKSLELALFNGEENVLPGEPVSHKWTDKMPAFPVKTSLKTGYRSGDMTRMNSFEEVYQAFLKQYLYQVDVFLKKISNAMEEDRDNETCSPFLAGTFPTCISTGNDPFRGGFTVENYQLLSGSIPTVADALAAIKKVVFDERFCTMAELLEALRANFEGFEYLRQKLLSAPKFGNDDDYVDCIAADIAKRFCERVSSFITPNGKPIWPGIYNIDFNMFAKIVGATPDGRRWKDPICEHYSPTPGRAKSGPTSVIRSATKAPLAKGCAASPFHISLSRSAVPQNEKGKAIVRSLLLTAIELGAVVFNIAIYDVDVLKKAKQNPEMYEDVIVRVWGFNARFVDLSEDLQDHIIARVIRGSE